ncbi:MAG: hypothetical protein HYS38_07830, partial [Acidobacteria bacterium]|nr:hypothetical protein [Acidobacteriota bacterium]
MLLDRSLTPRLRSGQALAALIILLALAFSPRLRAQTYNSGGTGALGDFINPLTVTSASN